MKLAFLKKIRVTISLLFFIALFYLFIDFADTLSTDIVNGVTYLQLIPSIMKFIALPALAAAGFIFVILLTLLFGRVYCSSICPLGTFQDISAWLTKKFSRKRKKYKYGKPYTILRYSFLGAAVFFLFLGSSIGLNLLDPFSNFGKMTVAFARPVVLFMNNIGASIAQAFDEYFIYPVDIKGYTIVGFIFPVIFLTVVLWMSIKEGRLYCNTVCPAGTFLGFLSKFSLFKISLKEEDCESCGVCAVVCKASCIDVKNKKIDFDRCVSCYNCFDACPTLGITYRSVFNNGSKKNDKEVPITDYSKREFIGATLGAVLGFSSASYAQDKIVPKKESTVPVNKKYHATPPGARSQEHFTEFCTACHLCVSECPTSVLQPSFLQYGFLGMMQPYMDYWTNYCNFDCKRCLEICPSGAILDLPLEDKKLTQLGVVTFIEDNCIVFTEKTECGACSEHCPTKAVTMEPKMFETKELRVPKLDTDICIGCGACEYACPTKPFKAIYVDGNPVHKRAKKPKQGEIRESQESEDDFAF